MVYATFRTDPRDEGPDVTNLGPCELVTFIGVSGNEGGDNYRCEAYVLGGEGLELESTARGIAAGAVRILMSLAGDCEAWQSLILAEYMKGLSMAASKFVDQEVFDKAMDILEEEKDGTCSDPDRY